MHDPALVRGCEALGDALRHRHRLAHRHRPRLQALAQAPTLQAFGDEVGHALLFADVVDDQDVRVIERARSPRFFRETAQLLCVAGQVRQQELDGDVAAQALVLRAPDLARAAGAELLHEGVRTDAPAGLQVQAFAGE